MRFVILAAGAIMVLAACGTDETAGLTPPPEPVESACGDLCLALAAEKEPVFEQELASEGDISCEVTSNGLRECVAFCETQDVSSECVRCTQEEEFCFEECGLNNPVEDSAWMIDRGLACWVGATQPAKACSGYSADVYAFIEPDLKERQIEYTGVAFAHSLDPLLFRLSSGQIYRAGPRLPMQYSVGDSFSLQFEISCPFNCYASYILRTEDGDLVQAAWNGRSPLPLPEVALDYQFGECFGVESRYANSIDLELLADSVAIAPGAELEVNGLTVSNGPSGVLYASFTSDIDGNGRYGLVRPSVAP